MTPWKTIEEGMGESSTVSETTTLFERLESFDFSENNVETDCGYFETPEEGAASGGEAEVEAQGTCGSGDEERGMTRGPEHMNGCGPEGASLPSEISGALTRPCNCHDECYEHGKVTYGFNKVDCDVIFRKDMHEACHNRFDRCIKQITIRYWWGKKTICVLRDVREPWCKWWAEWFYHIVLSLGWHYYFINQSWYPYLNYMNCR